MGTVRWQSDWNSKTLGNTTRSFDTRTVNFAMLNTATLSPDLENYKDTREKERNEMQILNNRLEQYLERSRDRADLNSDLNEMIKNIKEEIINDGNAQKELYEPEIEQLRAMLDEIEREKNEDQLTYENQELMTDELQTRVEELENYDQKDKQKIKMLDNMIQSLALKMKNLENKLDLIKGEGEAEKESINKLRGEIENLGKELNNEILIRTDYQNKCQSLDEAINFTKDVHNKELTRLSSLNNNNLFDPMHEFWNNEFWDCIAAIRAEYESILNRFQDEVNNEQNLKLSDIQESSLQSVQIPPTLASSVYKISMSNSEMQDRIEEMQQQNALMKAQRDDLANKMKDLKNRLNLLEGEKEREIEQLQMQLEEYNLELSEVIKGNETYQMEIMIYRTLLASEEKRIETSPIEETPVMESAPPTKVPKRIVTFKRSGNGPIVIHDVDSDGMYIMIENTSEEKIINMNRWQIVQIIDNKKDYLYTFGRFYMDVGAKTTIWANGCTSVGEKDIVLHNRNIIGVGDEVSTIILDPEGKETYKFTQKVSYR